MSIYKSVWLVFEGDFSVVEITDKSGICIEGNGLVSGIFTEMQKAYRYVNDCKKKDIENGHELPNDYYKIIESMPINTASIITETESGDIVKVEEY